MKTIRLLIAALLLCGLAAAQAPKNKAKAESKPTLADTLNRSFSGVEHEFVDAADAMPADKYDFAPTEGEFKGVRTFGQQVRHVAAANYMIAAAILGEAKPPVDTGGENGPESISSKDDIMKYLKDSFEYVHKAFGSITSEQKAMEMTKSPFGPNQVTKMSLVLVESGHPFDHYGQMVEYLRMNGIIPPASRPRPNQGQ
jgi:uncharacterized damage-inducible protein DinB